MRCPLCSGKSTIMESRWRPVDKSTYRRHKCLVCRNAFTTKEIYMPEDNGEYPLLVMKSLAQRRSNDTSERNKELISDRNNGMTYKELAYKYGISKQCANQIVLKYLKDGMA